jgi:hypothetical protein
MTRFLIALAVAALIGVGAQNKVLAQVSYSYTVPSTTVTGAFSGVNSQYTTYSPFGAATNSTFYSPYFGTTTGTNGSYYNPFTGSSRNYSSYTSPYGTLSQSYGSYYTPYGGIRNYSNYSTPYGSYNQNYTTNAFGNGVYNSSFYNPSTGYRYGSTTYQPNSYLYPGVGYTSNWVRRR